VALSLAAPVLIPATSPLASLYEQPLPLWAYATLTQNLVTAHSGTFGPLWLGITWSLAIEEQFYLLLPMIVRFVPSRRLPYVLVCAIMAAPLLRTLLFRFLPQGGFAASVLMPCRADALLLGVLCAYLMRRERIAQFIADHMRHLYSWFGVLLLGTVFLILTAPPPPALSSLMISFGYTWLALLYACLLLIAITEKRGILSGIARISPLRSLGGIAYGVYLFHQALHVLSHGLILGQSPQIRTLLDALVTLGALLLTLTVAQLSWTFFEKRIVALGHSVKYVTADL
jgi:peptidoglycan/LPS O-acetylase OafA/YrhL